VPGDRERLRATFDAAAQDYQQARPDYPDELYGSLIRQSGIRPGDRLLEIGCATGKATRPLARRGFLITCVEIGPALAAAARQELAPFAGVDVVHADFETWQPEPAQAFDLVFAATAWHWLDPALKYRRAWRLLRPAGHLAVWEAIHVVPAGGDTFFGDLQEVYDAIGEGLPPGTALPRPDELPGQAAEIEASGLFGAVTSRLFDWEVVYTAEEYILPVPVTDVDRAKAFYVEQVGFNADHDVQVNPELRFVQLTPPGSACSIVLGTGITTMKPGTQLGLMMVVEDVAAARAQLIASGVQPSEIDVQPWGSFIYFGDPDGNTWTLQQLPPRS
jgi:SAM-dependent methyltransferase